MLKSVIAVLGLVIFSSCTSSVDKPAARQKEKRAWLSSLEFENVYGDVWKIEETSDLEFSSGPHFKRSYFDENGMLVKHITNTGTTDSTTRTYTSDLQNHFLSLTYFENGEEIKQTVEYSNNYKHAFINFSSLKSPFAEVWFDENGHTQCTCHMDFNSGKTRTDSTVFAYQNGLKVSERTYMQDSLRLVIEYKYDADGHVIDKHWVQYTNPAEDHHTLYVYEKDKKKNWVKQGTLNGSDTVNIVYRKIFYRDN